MNIRIEKSQDHYRADCLDMPGSPPVGLGETKEMAVACLFWRLYFENTGGRESCCWLSFLNRKDPITVDGKIWDWPKSYKR